MRQQQFLEVLDRDEAERRWRAVIDATPRGVEVVPLAQALSRVLADDVVASVDVPGFDRANNSPTSSKACWNPNTLPTFGFALIRAVA